MQSVVSEKPAKAKKRKAFLEAGYALFSQKGIDAVALQDVANASGYGIATLYRYFDTKAGLLLAIAHWKWEEFFQENSRRRPSEGFADKTAADMFDFYLESFLVLYKADKDLLRFNQFTNIYLRSEEAGPETREIFQGLMGLITQFFHAMYEKAKVDHTLRTDIPEIEMLSVTLHLMLAAVTRYAVGLLFEPPGFNDVRELETLKEMICLEYKK